jgi:hypothetical protein
MAINARAATKQLNRGKQGHPKSNKQQMHDTLFGKQAKTAEEAFRRSLTPKSMRDKGQVSILEGTANKVNRYFKRKDMKDPDKTRNKATLIKSAGKRKTPITKKKK